MNTVLVGMWVRHIDHPTAAGGNKICRRDDIVGKVVALEENGIIKVQNLYSYHALRENEWEIIPPEEAAFLELST